MCDPRPWRGLASSSRCRISNWRLVRWSAWSQAWVGRRRRRSSAPRTTLSKGAAGRPARRSRAPPRRPRPTRCPRDRTGEIRPSRRAHQPEYRLRRGHWRSPARPLGHHQARNCSSRENVPCAAQGLTPGVDNGAVPEQRCTHVRDEGPHRRFGRAVDHQIVLAGAAGLGERQFPTHRTRTLYRTIAVQISDRPPSQQLPPKRPSCRDRCPYSKDSVCIPAPAASSSWWYFRSGLQAC